MNSSPQTIVAVNNIGRALQAKASQLSDFIYSPKVHSKIQMQFHQSRFLAIQAQYPKAQFLPNKNWYDINNIIAFSWDSHDEALEFKSSMAPAAQNRLLSRGPAKVPNSFTGFLRKIEKNLPNTYSEAILPSDPDVLKRLRHYFYEGALPSSYFLTRNTMTEEDGSSRFSAFTSCGALDVRHLYNEIKDYEKRESANKSTYWLIYELLWREFFYWHYQGWGRSYFSKNGIHGSLSFTLYEDFEIEKLRDKSTNTFWQASLSELTTTGFQTNRTRQLFASFWIHELHLDWRSGALFFEKQLIDYDVYSNWGNWMYIAGVGSSSRGARRFDINNQLERYDPENEYTKKWL